MKSIARIAVLALALSSGAAFAAERTATLEVTNISCGSCIPIVKRTLAGTAGVNAVTVVVGSSGIGTATVTFDDSKTSAAALVEATTKAGYPAKAAP